MEQAFRYKLYRSKRTRHLHRLIDAASEIYKHAIALHKRYYRMTGKHLNIYVLKRHITKLKRRSREAIDAYYPSSKTCCSCGAINDSLGLFDRRLLCPACDKEHDRDLNAATVIHMVGAPNHWERSSKTAARDSSNSACVPESHMLAVGVRQTKIMLSRSVV